MKVFISHSSKDKPFVRKLKRDLTPLIKSLSTGEKTLSRSDKDELLSNKVLNYSKDDNLVVLHFKVMGFKSISNFLANQIPKSSIESYDRKTLDEFKPVLLPISLNKYLGKLRFGDVLTFKNRRGKMIKGDFARYSSTNNRISLPREIRSFLDIDNLTINRVTLEIGTKTLFIEPVSDKQN